ncbi:MAG: histidine triad nucleotide-binding protein [Tatlockia sp.]|jgi:histidine triad (HIT) family protein
MACLFCNIANGKIPAKIVFDDESLLVIEDINPQAPTHLLVLPKQHIATLDDTNSQNEQLLGHMVLTAKKMARDRGLTEKGYRLVFNVNSGGGQEVFHIHLHVLGGRQMTWPPG